MEGARRIDEWSRIADVVPNLGVIPELAPVDEDRDGDDGGAMLDLLPHEWQVLTMIDGERDLRAIAAVARRATNSRSRRSRTDWRRRASSALRRADAERRTSSTATGVASRVAAARALTRAGRHADAVEELRRAMQEDPLTPRVHLDFAFAAARARRFRRGARRAGSTSFVSRPTIGRGAGA